MDRRLDVCRASDLEPGDRVVARYKGRDILVINIGGRYHALLARCPHQGANLCAAVLCGTALPAEGASWVYGHEGRVLRCPWHGWEFDVESGESLAEPRVKVRTYRTAVDDGRVVVYI